MKTIPTNHGNATPAQVVSQLMYVSYATQRDHGMTSESAAKLLSVDREAYEARYQDEAMRAVVAHESYRYGPFDAMGRRIA